MKQKELQALMKRMGFYPSRNMGQNFLIDDNLLEFIVRRAEIAPDELVLEVGPGFGSLTRKLLAAGAEVLAVEFDHRLANFLRETIDPMAKFTLTEADAVKVDYQSLLGGRPFRMVANLPYSISSPLIMKLVELPEPPRSMFTMLQREVGERFAAPPRNKDYGALSVMVQFCYKVEIVRIIPPQVFLPPPEVDSALIKFDGASPMPSLSERKLLARLVRTAFSQRRKKMQKQISSVFGAEPVAAAMAVAGISPDVRAEEVSVAQFARLAQELRPTTLPISP